MPWADGSRTHPESWVRFEVIVQDGSGIVVVVWNDRVTFVWNHACAA